MNIPKKQKVLYILGYSRSGSTILNIMLGNIDSMFSAGEINNYLKSAWINDHYCSCGKTASECEFWPTVKKSMEKSLQIDPTEIISISQKLENWRDLVRTRFSKTDESKARQEKYDRFNSELITTISELQKKEWVVDASKSPVRLNYLVESNALDCSAVHIVRDPRGVCWSLMKATRKNVEAGVQTDLPSVSYIATIKSLYLNAALAERVKRKIPTKQLLVRYDDLTNSPTETIEAIGSMLKTDTSSLLKLVESDESFQQEHNIAGNRLRMKRDIKLRHEQSWKSELPTFQFFVITLLTLPLLLKYKFPLNRRLSAD